MFKSQPRKVFSCISIKTTAFPLNITNKKFKKNILTISFLQAFFCLVTTSFIRCVFSLTASVRLCRTTAEHSFLYPWRSQEDCLIRTTSSAFQMFTILRDVTIFFKRFSSISLIVFFAKVGPTFVSLSEQYAMITPLKVILTNNCKLSALLAINFHS